MAPVSIPPNGNLLRSAEPGSLADADSQGDFRQQIANLTDLCRQVFGDAAVLPGGGGPSDPLNAAFELYVDPVRGSDKFVHGEYSSYDPPGADLDTRIQNKLRRISNQRLTCGYTKERPFRTINRAAIEAAIITSRNWFISDPKTFVDCIVIHLSAGTHVVLNDPGTAAPAAWPDGFVPTDADLIRFNPPEGGVILPRYASLQGADLRKTTLRPNWVPGSANEAPDYSNRSAIVRLTPNALVFGMSFFDRWGATTSHHLLSCFGFASAAMLARFYDRVNTACGAGAYLSPTLLVPRSSETNIVGPFAGQADENWDIVSSSSAYVYNCSIRSLYGLGGIFLDGNLVGGLRSFVVAQFTGVSLQRDITCWEVYKSGNWRAPTTYAELVSSDPDDTRMNTLRLSRHVAAINRAFIQEVSVFAIGQGVHHFVDSGGEITITNSNSTFGGCAALARGYRSPSFPIDTKWQITKVKLPTNLADEVGNVRRIPLGKIEAGTANDTLVIKLEQPLEQASNDPATPAVLARDGYSLRAGTYLWVDNPTGRDFRAPLATGAWSNGAPTEIRVTAAMINEEGVTPGSESSSGQVSINTPDLEGLAVYVRRLVDVRSPDERSYSLQLTNTTNTRTPVRDFILQLDTAAAGVNRALSATENLLVTESIRRDDPETGANFDAEIVIRRGNPASLWAANTFFRVGDVVRQSNKHYSCQTNHTSGAAFDVALWSEVFVHMPTGFNPEDFRKNSGPTITFDSDTSGTESSTTLGYNLTTVWNSDARVSAQLYTATDYRGLDLFLTALGFNSADRRTLLTPRAAASRTWNPQAGVAGISPPAGAVTGWSNWACEFRRPSVIRLYSHAWEWAGFLNYSKSLPPVQAEMSPQNKFSYYFTNEDGGRVFATGNNEDGFEVSPSGLTNISTGEQKSVENLGGSDFTLGVSSNFNKLEVSELTVNNKLIINGSVTGLPLASTTQRGVVDLATNQEASDAFLNNLLPPLRANAALTLSSMPGLKDGVLRAVRLLEKRFTRIYIDGSIVRSGPTVDTPCDPATIPDAVWQDIKWQRSLHELGDWSGIVPPVGSSAYSMGSLLCFSNLTQAAQFINSRMSEGNQRIVLSVYGSSTCTGTVTYRNITPLNIERGRSQPGQGVSSESTASGGTVGDKKLYMAPTIYMNNNWFFFASAAEVNIINLDINVNGIAAEPDRYGLQDTAFLDGVRTVKIGLKNVYIKMRTFSQYYIYVFLDPHTIIYHRIPQANVPVALIERDRSVLTFDVQRIRRAGAGGPLAGATQIIRATNVEIDTTAPNTTKSPGRDSAREVHYIVDQGTEDTPSSGLPVHPVIIFQLVDGFFLQRSQIDVNKSDQLGSLTTFDIHGGASTIFRYIIQAGPSSNTSALNARFIHEFSNNFDTEPPVPFTPGDVRWDHVCRVDRFVTTTSASASAWTDVTIISIGYGMWTDFKLSFDDSAHSVSRVADEFYDYMAVRQGVTKPALIAPQAPLLTEPPTGPENGAWAFARIRGFQFCKFNFFLPTAPMFYALKRMESGGRQIAYRDVRYNDLVTGASFDSASPEYADAFGYVDTEGSPQLFLPSTSTDPLAS